MKLYNVSTKKLIFFIFIVALLIRIIFGIVHFQKYGTEKFGDDWDYISYAENIISQGIFVPDISKLHNNSHLVGPGFPLIVAASFSLFGQQYMPVIILNALLSSLLCILIYFLGKTIFNEKIGLLAGGWSIFYILFIRYVPTVLKEAWVAFLFPLVIYIFIIETRKKRLSLNLLLCVFLYAFLIHMDERFFVYFPILTISFLILDKESWKNGLKKSVLFMTLVIILMIPWSIRNYYVYDRPIILTERTARFTDKLLGYDSADFNKGEIGNERLKFVWSDKYINPILSGKEVPGLRVGSGEYKSIQRGLKHGVIPHNYSTLERWYAEFMEFWRPFSFSLVYVGGGFRSEGPWSLKHNLSLGISYGLLLPFFLVGIIVGLKRKEKIMIFLISIIFIHTFVHVVLAHVRNRYRIPIDSFIIIIAFYGIIQIYNLIKNKWSKRKFMIP